MKTSMLAIDRVYKTLKSMGVAGKPILSNAQVGQKAKCSSETARVSIHELITQKVLKINKKTGEILSLK